METIKLLVFDIDGTLVDRSKQTVESSAIHAIHQAKENGYEILIATGRSFYFIHDDVIKNVDTDYYVTINGACLNDSKGSVIQQYAFDQASLETLIDYCDKHNYALGIKYANYMGIYGDYKYFVENYVGFDHPGVKYLIEDKDRNFFMKDEPLGVFYFANPETYTEAKTLIPNLNFIPDARGVIEAIRHDVDKTKNISDVLTRLNLTWDNVMAFGDGNNDIEMLTKAKIGVAMGNAGTRVKESADYVTDDILNDGIEKALKHFKLI